MNEENIIQKSRLKPYENEIIELGYREAVKLVIDSLSLNPKLRVLDIYFGSNPLVPFLFKESQVNYFGFETSTQCIVKSKNAYKYYIRQRKAYFGDFDGLHIPYVMNFFQRVLSIYPKIDWICMEDYLHEIHRVMAPDGILVFVWKIQNYKECLKLIECVQLCSFMIDDLKVLQLNFDQQSLERHKSAFFILSKSPGGFLTQVED